VLRAWQLFAVSALAALSSLSGAQTPASAQPASIDAPNVVVISPQLVTSGQPTAAALGKLAEQGFKAVIYLAPPTVPDAIRDETEIVRGQGLSYLNIPIKFGDPTEADFDAFVKALAKFEKSKVLVHCQVNMRASSMVFLHRVVVGKESPEKAYESVARVWSPEGPWKALMKTVLARNRIAFEPY